MLVGAEARIPSRPRRLDEEQRARLHRRYAEQPTPDVLEALVISYRPLAHALAHRYATGRHTDPDLEQAACEGLIKALRRFDPDRGTSFTAFAVPTILGEVRRYIRDTSWPAHVPRKVQERVRALREQTERHAAQTGRAPTVAELAGLLSCSEEEVVEGLCAASSAATVSLHAERASDDGLTLADRVGDVDPNFDRVEAVTAIEWALPSLPVEEQLVVGLHFGDEMTQRQIAARLGYSRSHVGRLLGSALEHLRAAAA